LSSKIHDSNDWEKSILQKLVELVEKTAGASVVLLDIVSVEIENNKPFYVKWLANKDTLTLYQKLVSKFFQSENNKSLLFLQPDDDREKIKGIGSRVVHFSNDQTISAHKWEKFNFEQYLEDSFYNEKGNYIASKSENEAIEKWRIEILEKIKYGSAVLTKIDFTISKRKYVAAIWLVFDADTNELLFTSNFHLKSHIFNFLWTYSTITIASNLIDAANAANTKNAISDIINRNYAHHIGSHVSHRATFEKILDRLSIDFNDIKKDELASVAQMRKRLEKYKDERSEFIASVGGMASSQSFYFYTEVIRPFLENTLVMDNIAANEGIRYFPIENSKMDTTGKLSATEKAQSLSQLVVRVFIHKELTKQKEHGEKYDSFREDLKVEVPKYYLEQRVIYFNPTDEKVPLFDSTSIPYFLHTTDMNDTFYSHSKLLLDDIQINLPGTLGKHTIYSLLENYIRNTAKHAYNVKDHYKNQVEIILKLSPDKDNLDKIIFEITDNISDAESKSGNGKTIVDKLNASINANLSEKQGMGIADMKISACLLAEKDLLEENLRNSLKVSASEKGTLEKRNLVYTMKLSKPKQVALIGCDYKEDSPANGIFKFSDIGAYINSSNLSFQFAILDENAVNHDDLMKNKHLLPLRLFICVEEEANSKFDRSNSRYTLIKKNDLIKKDDLLHFLWEIWTEFKVGHEKSELSLYLEQDKGDYPTDKWIDAAKKLNNDERKFSINVCTNDSIVTDEDSRLILYDRHAKLVSSASNTKFIQDNFWELIDKQNPDFDLIFSTNPEQKPFVLPYEMIDAALNNILVIDERVAEIANTKIDNCHMNEILGKGFQKFTTEDKITLFDYCWAAGVYVCTHIKGIHVHSNNNKDNCKSEHFLDVEFTKNEHDKKVNVKYSSNFIQFYNTKSKVEVNGKKESLWRSTMNGDNKSKCDVLTENDLQIKFDCLLIHRTKLKELVENKDLGNEFISNLTIPKIYIITGGGVVDFLNGNESKITILPTNVLKDFIMNGRISKLALNKILK